MLERKVKTHDWAKRVNMSLFAMIVVDTYLVYSQSTDSEGTQKDFYHDLAEDLIDNNFDGAAAGGRRSRENINPNPTLSSTTAAPRCGEHIHITPAKRRRMRRGEATNYAQQGNAGFAVRSQ
jgi:hypothetical protein